MDVNSATPLVADLARRSLKVLNAILVRIFAIVNEDASTPAVKGRVHFVGRDCACAHSFVKTWGEQAGELGADSGEGHSFTTCRGTADARMTTRAKRLHRFEPPTIQTGQG